MADRICAGTPSALSGSPGIGTTVPVDIVWKILGTLALVAMNGYFVATEFCAVTARPTRIRAKAVTSPLYKIAWSVKQNLGMYLSATQLGVTIASLGLGAIMEPAISSALDPIFSLLHLPGHARHVLAYIVSFGIGTSLHIVLGEQVPKNWAIRNSDRFLAYLAPPLVAFRFMLYPLIWLLNEATVLCLRFLGVEVEPPKGEAANSGLGTGDFSSVPHTAEELRTLVAEAIKGGTIKKADEQILASAFEFGDLKVRQIMTPRTEVDYLRVGQPIGEMLKIVQNSNYTRLPLCDGDIDHVIGLVHMKDLFVHLKLVPGKLRFSDEKTPGGEEIFIADGKPGGAVHVIGSGDIDLNRIRRDVLIAPELMPVSKLLRDFQTSRVHMAVVVDEYGATLGIVTLEDVVEELVGDIADEFDPMPRADFLKDGENFRVAGDFPVRQLREKLPLAEIEPETTVDTVGGYITQQLGRFPRGGDIVDLGAYTARVIAVQSRRVTQVLITPKTQEVARVDGPGTRE